MREVIARHLAQLVVTPDICSSDEELWPEEGTHRSACFFLSEVFPSWWIYSSSSFSLLPLNHDVQLPAQNIVTLDASRSNNIVDTSGQLASSRMGLQVSIANMSEIWILEWKDRRAGVIDMFIEAPKSNPLAQPRLRVFAAIIPFL